MNPPSAGPLCGCSQARGVDSIMSGLEVKRRGEERKGVGGKKGFCFTADGADFTDEKRWETKGAIAEESRSSHNLEKLFGRASNSV